MLTMPLKESLITLAVGFGVAVAAIALFQRNLIYFPDTRPFVPAEWSLRGFETLNLTAADGLHVQSWYRPARKGNPFTIVFFQGNGGHPGHRNAKLQAWGDAGYGLLLVGYRGYGGNPGKPTEEGIYDDARAALNALKAKDVQGTAPVLYGESLGTGVATQMATEFPAAALILEAPFTSLADAGARHYPYLPVRWLLRDRYDSLSKIKGVRMPLLLLHGERDKVVPVNLGRQLFAAANEPKQAEFFPQAGHNDLYDYNAQPVVLTFLTSLTRRPVAQTASAPEKEEKAHP